MTEEKQIDYKKCLYNLLVGLKIQQVDEFMSYADEDDCLLLGTIYSDEMQEILNRSILPSGWKEPTPPSSES